MRKGLPRIPDGYGRLRKVIGPYILRRLKTDKSVISDLPDKVEMKTWATLCRKQAILYQKKVDELRLIVESAEGIQRKGIILSAPQVQADLQPSGPLRWERRFRRSRERRVRRLARNLRNDPRKAGAGPRVHPVPRDDRAAAQFLSGIFKRQGLCCTAAPRWANARRSWSGSRERIRALYSAVASKPAALA